MRTMTAFTTGTHDRRPSRTRHAARLRRATALAGLAAVGFAGAPGAQAAERGADPSSDLTRDRGRVCQPVHGVDGLLRGPCLPWPCKVTDGRLPWPCKPPQPCLPWSDDDRVHPALCRPWPVPVPVPCKTVNAQPGGMDRCMPPRPPRVPVN